MKLQKALLFAAAVLVLSSPTTGFSNSGTDDPDFDKRGHRMRPTDGTSAAKPEAPANVDQCQPLLTRLSAADRLLAQTSFNYYSVRTWGLPIKPNMKPEEITIELLWKMGLIYQSALFAAAQKEGFERVQDVWNGLIIQDSARYFGFETAIRAMESWKRPMARAELERQIDAAFGNRGQWLKPSITDGKSN